MSEEYYFLTIGMKIWSYSKNNTGDTDDVAVETMEIEIPLNQEKIEELKKVDLARLTPDDEQLILDITEEITSNKEFQGNLEDYYADFDEQFTRHEILINTLEIEDDESIFIDFEDVLGMAVELSMDRNGIKYM